MTPMEIAARVRKALERDGRPQSEIAKRLGINAVTLRKFKADLKPLSFETLTALAEELGLEITVREKKRK